MRVEEDINGTNQIPLGSRGGAILFLLLAWVPTAFYCVYGLPYLIKAWQAHLWVLTPCRVVSCEPVHYFEGRHHQFEFYGAEVTYSYEFKGGQYTASRYSPSWSYCRMNGVTPEVPREHFPRGRELICYVNPGNPAEAVMDPHFTEEQVNAMMVIPPLLLLIGFIAPIRYIRAAMRERAPDLSRPPCGISFERGLGGATQITSRCCFPQLVLLLLILIPFAILTVRPSIFYGHLLETHASLGQSPSVELLPFLIPPLLLLVMIAYLRFTRYTVTLDGGAGTVFVGIGRLGRTRRFTCHRDSPVGVRVGEGLSVLWQTGIVVGRDDEEFAFGALLSGYATEFIADMITEHVRQLR